MTHPDNVDARVLPGVGASALELTDHAAEVAGGSAPRTAAFFDLDNTLVQGAAVFHLARGLYRRDFFGPKVILRAFWLQAWFRLVGKENAGHLEDARAAALAFIAGHTVAEVTETAEEVYEDSLEARIWPGTRALAQQHLDEGRSVWLVTAAPVEVAGVVAARLGMDGALGTTAEHVDGVYTGRLRGELLHGAAKADAVRALAAAEGLDLAGSIAYSDSFNDLPMLTAVGRAGAINPDRRLRRHAQQEGWPVREFRQARRFSLLGAAVAGGATGAVATGLVVRRVLRR